MFSKAVVCTDLTRDSDALVACVGSLAMLGVSEVVLTYAVDIFDDPDIALEHMRHAGGDAFERQAESMERVGFGVHVEAPLGHPAFCVEEVRRNHGADLIVVGCGSTDGSEQPFSGSVSSDLVHVSRTPIFVAASARPCAGTHEADTGAGLLEHILVCTDFSETSRRAFEAAEGLVETGARRFTLLHVEERGAGRTGLDAAATECDRRDTVKLARLKDELVRLGAGDVEIRIVRGSPAEELSLRAASGDYSLVVLGTRGASPASEEPVTDVSDRILRHTRTPLLMVPHGESDTESPSRAPMSGARVHDRPAYGRDRSRGYGRDVRR